MPDEQEGAPIPDEVKPETQKTNRGKYLKIAGAITLAGVALLTGGAALSMYGAPALGAASTAGTASLGAAGTVGSAAASAAGTVGTASLGAAGTVGAFAASAAGTVGAFAASAAGTVGAFAASAAGAVGAAAVAAAPAVLGGLAVAGAALGISALAVATGGIAIVAVAAAYVIGKKVQMNKTGVLEKQANELMQQNPKLNINTEAYNKFKQDRPTWKQAMDYLSGERHVYNTFLEQEIIKAKNLQSGNDEIARASNTFDVPNERNSQANMSPANIDRTASKQASYKSSNTFASLMKNTLVNLNLSSNSSFTNSLNSMQQNKGNSSSR